MSENGNPFNLPSFREELGQVFDDKLKPVTDLLEKHAEELREHRDALQRARGARWAFGIVWGAILAVVTAIVELIAHGGKH